MPRRKPSPVMRSVKPAASSSQAARNSVRMAERWLPPARAKQENSCLPGRRSVAARGAIVRIDSRRSDELRAGRGYELAALHHEQAISTNTAAAGGNAQLMTMS